MSTASPGARLGLFEITSVRQRETVAAAATSSGASLAAIQKTRRLNSRFHAMRAEVFVWGFAPGPPSSRITRLRIEWSALSFGHNACLYYSRAILET